MACLTNWCHVFFSFLCSFIAPLQYQTLLWSTYPTAKSITRPQSAGGCLTTTYLLITTCSNTAGGCKHPKKSRQENSRRRCRSMGDQSFLTIIFLTSRIRGPSQPASQEDGEDSGVWRATERVHGPSTVVCDVDPNSLYAFRVRSCRNSMFSPYSPEVTFHTPPAPGEPERRGTFTPWWLCLSLSFMSFKTGC